MKAAGAWRERVRALVDIYYDVQDVRIRSFNRLRQVGAVEGVSPELLKQLEGELAKRLRGEIEGMAIYEGFLKGIKGLGPVLSAGIIATFDIRRADHPSSFWRYAGLHTVGGRAPKRRRGEKTDWNPKAKVLAWKIGRSFLMARTPLYADLYESAKAEEARKLNRPIEDPSRCPHFPECAGRLKRAGRPPCALHIHQRAFRKMVKRFLADLHVAWRGLEGLPVSEPYVIALLGHEEQEPQALAGHRLREPQNLVAGPNRQRSPDGGSGPSIERNPPHFSD